MSRSPASGPSDGLRAFFLVGPTGVGKTALAHGLARRNALRILSADSMLVYRGMDRGTDKPSPEQQRAWGYGGIDLVAPDGVWNVAAYRQHALDFLRRAQEDRVSVLVAGGTGLYIKALLEGLASGPAPDEALRFAGEALLKAQGKEAFRRWARAQAGTAWEALAGEDNPRRLLRALERVRAGLPARAESWNRFASACLPGLQRTAADLRQRITVRAERMFQEGLLEEAAALRKRYGRLSRTARQAIGYREAWDVLQGRLTTAAAVEHTVLRTLRLAKRQRTWFRHQAQVQWVDLPAGKEAGEAQALRIEAFWRIHGPTPVQH